MNQSADYRLSPGDQLTIVVYDQPQLSGDFIIDGGGGLLLPLAGPVSLSGRTLAEAQELIQDKFADGILVKPGVSVRIKEYRPIFVTGSVRRPGSYPFIALESVKAAIAAAGGKGEPIEASLNGSVSDFITAGAARAAARIRLRRVARAQGTPGSPTRRSRELRHADAGWL